MSKLKQTQVDRLYLCGEDALKEGEEGAPECELQADPFAILKARLHEEVIGRPEYLRLGGDGVEELRKRVEGTVAALLARMAVPMSRQERLRLISEVADEVVGLGPLEPLVNDATVTEIMVNRCDQVYVERAGKIHLSKQAFKDDGHVMRIIERIVAPLGRRIDESNPMVDARLPDGSRVNAIIPPLAIDGPVLTIRKFSKIPLTADDLVRFGSLTPAMMAFLRACVHVRLNLIVSGGTGTGKTSFLNVLSSFCFDDERIVTIEDPAELRLGKEHIVRLETRPPNIEGRGQVTQRDLLRNALRMRPDRIIIGEVRGAEAFEMLQAMNTGHDGSISTIHANTPRDAVARIENMVLTAGLELPSRAIREQITSAIHIIIQLTRLRDGSRKVTQISEIAGMEGNVVTMQDTFKYEQETSDEHGAIKGYFTATGLRSRFDDRFRRAGIELPANIYQPAPGFRP